MNEAAPQENTLYREAKKAYSRSFCNLVIYAIVGIVLVFLIALLVRPLFPDGKFPTWMTYILNFAPMYLLAFPVYLLVSKPMEKHTPDGHKMHIGQLLLAFLCCEGLAVSGNFIGMIVNLILTLLVGTETSSTMLQDGVFGDSGLLFVSIAVLCAPIVEEMLFRKILIDRIRKYGDKTAIVVSGLLFGLFHGNFSQFFYAAFLGAFFAFIYVRTGRIRYTIMLHLAVNFCGSCLPLFLMQNLDLEEMMASLTKGDFSVIPVGFVVYVILVYCMAFSGIGVLIANLKKFRVGEPMAVLPRREHILAVTCNLGSVLFLLLCVYEFVSQVLANQTQ